MPLPSLVRLPLPNLRTYAISSTILFAVAIFYISNWEEQDKTPNGYDNSGFNFFDILPIAKNDSKVFYILGQITREPWCLLVFINQAYCFLMLFGKAIQKLVFGQLRIVEQQHAKDKFWNFVFYKFIYIFGVMNVQEIEEIILWFAWFSILGFLHILATLSKDRFEYNSSSPSVSSRTHGKVLSLLTYLHVVSWCLLLVSAYFWTYYISINTFAFMMAESLMLIIKTLYVLVRYGIHLKDAAHEGAWENRATLVYYSDLVFEVSALFIDFLHHLHMLLYGNIFLSMASLVIGLQLKQLYYELKRRIKRHENYRRVVSSMETKFPMATGVEIKKNDDDCAICWEKMDSARKLPCGHMFHNTCLRSWLEQDTTCPTCRLNLRELQVLSSIINQSGSVDVERPVNFVVDAIGSQGHRQSAGALGQAIPIAPQNRRVMAGVRRTSYFHFDGSRILSWLPSFSVEVMQPNPLAGEFGQNSILDGMVQQVREIFQNYPASVIREDIVITRSVEQTIDNIVEGRLVIPEGLAEREDIPMGDSPASLEEEEEEDDDDDVITDDTIQSGRSDNMQPTPGRDEGGTNDLGAIGSSLNNFASDGRSANPSLASSILPLSVDALQANEECQGQAADGIGMGFRFSKSSTEREQMLLLRKKKLLEEARRKYIQKNCPSSVLDKSSTLNNKKSLLLDAASRSNRDTLRSRDVGRRLSSRNQTEGSPVDGVDSSPANSLFGFGPRE